MAVTAHPTAAWTAQQLRNAFPENEVPRYLLHDRDSVFTHAATTLDGMNIQEVRTTPRSPWQNAYVERVIGSIRRECLDHVIVTSAAGLHRVLTAYVGYYLHSRTHLALGKDTPSRRLVTPPSAGRIVALPEVGGSITVTTASRHNLGRRVAHTKHPGTALSSEARYAFN